MPQKPARPCRYPGCPALTDDHSGYCVRHLRFIRKAQDEQRGTAAERGYDRRWQKYRLSYLADHPLCALCAKKEPPVVKAATEVHHIKALSDGGTHEENNLMALCHGCHSSLTAKIQGFGRGEIAVHSASDTGGESHGLSP